MGSPLDRRDFLKTAAATLALLTSRQGLGLAQMAYRKQKRVRFDERQREVIG